jgi:hypothetical protein
MRLRRRDGGVGARRRLAARGKVMKSSFVVGLGLLSLSAGPLIAADLPVKAAPPPAPYNWTGCYGDRYFGSLFDESG